LANTLARNIAHGKTIAGLRAERDDLKSQVKKLKAEAVEKGDLLMASEESCKAFSDQVKTL
jgi:cell division protein FtsB